MSEETVTIPLETAQRLFDALTTSMDFGSGFLETDDVVALRGLAEAIGVDPDVGTPAGHKRNYPHAFEAMTNPRWIDQVFGIRRVVAVAGTSETVRNDEVPPFTPCNVGLPFCGRAEGDPLHQGSA